MGEVVGVATVGNTSIDEIMASSYEREVVAVTLAGGSAVSYVAGQALVNSATAGKSEKYTNTGSTTGACILLTAEATTVAGGDVVANALVAGSVYAHKVVDSAGAEADAAFQAVLNNVRFV